MIYVLLGLLVAGGLLLARRAGRGRAARAAVVPAEPDVKVPARTLDPSGRRGAGGDGIA